MKEWQDEAWNQDRWLCSTFLTVCATAWLKNNEQIINKKERGDSVRLYEIYLCMVCDVFRLLL